MRAVRSISYSYDSSLVGAKPYFFDAIVILRLKGITVNGNKGFDGAVERNAGGSDFHKIQSNIFAASPKGPHPLKVSAAGI